MDFQQTVDSIGGLACVVSVEALENGRCGEIRIVTGNQAYIDSIEKPVENMQMLTTEFVPNSLYTRYLTRDLNFEDYCYRSAVRQQCLHSYAHPERIDAWFSMTFIPLQPNEGNIHYCIYLMEIDFEPSSERLSNVSGKLASMVLGSSIKLRDSKDFRGAMTSIVKELREFCKTDNCTILLTDHRRRTCTVLCDDNESGSGNQSILDYCDDDLYSLTESWKDTIAGSNCLAVKNESEMEVVRKRNPRWHKSLMDAGVHTIVLFPLKSRDELLGYMWAVNFDPEDCGKIKEALELATVVLGAEIGNYLFVDMLKELSSRDMLTGLLNRNELNNVMNRLSTEGAPEKSVGIIFADLNNLKEINDTEGHDAGDDLIKRAAETLRKACSDDEVFRAGGDEFVVILVGITEEELERKVAVIKESSRKGNQVAFAIGSCLEGNCRNVNEALRIADELMYADKKAYYERFPKKR